MKHAFVLAFIALICAGCARKAWYNPAKGERDFYRDRAQCNAMSNSSTPVNIQMVNIGSKSYANSYAQGAASGEIIGANITRAQIFNDCMMGEGWYLREK